VWDFPRSAKPNPVSLLLNNFLGGCSQLEMYVQGSRMSAHERLNPFDHPDVCDCPWLRLNCFPVKISAEQVVDYLFTPRGLGQKHRSLELAFNDSLFHGDVGVEQFLEIVRKVNLTFTNLTLMWRIYF
jgi:hypothetical protein